MILALMKSCCVQMEVQCFHFSEGTETSLSIHQPIAQIKRELRVIKSAKLKEKIYPVPDKYWQKCEVAGEVAGDGVHCCGVGFHTLRDTLLN